MNCADENNATNENKAIRIAILIAKRINKVTACIPSKLSFSDEKTILSPIIDSRIAPPALLRIFLKIFRLISFCLSCTSDLSFDFNANDVNILFAYIF